jgi:hypothetical protein
MVATLASAAISRIGVLGKESEYLKLRERCHGVAWNSSDGSLDRVQGALDGSVDKWIEILQLISSFTVTGSAFLVALQGFLTGPENGEKAQPNYLVDLGPFVRAWGRACDVPASVPPTGASVKETLQAINSFRNRFAHVPFPYDQVQGVYRELEECVFRLFEVPPTACNDESPLSGSFGTGDSVLRGPGYRKPIDAWQPSENPVFVWGKEATMETWDARPFVIVDQMMRPYLLSRLKNEAGSWEYIRYLAEANAVHSIVNARLLDWLPRPTEKEYTKDPESDSQGKVATPDDTRPPNRMDPPIPPAGPLPKAISSREDVYSAFRDRRFPEAIEFCKKETVARPSYHSGWQRLGFAQREYGVDLMDTDEAKAESLFHESIGSLTRAAQHMDPQFAADALYNRSKAHWRLWRLKGSPEEIQSAIRDADDAAKRYYEHRFVSWSEFLRENNPAL